MVVMMTVAAAAAAVVVVVMMMMIAAQALTSVEDRDTMACALAQMECNMTSLCNTLAAGTRINSFIDTMKTCPLLFPTATESPPQKATEVRGAEPIFAVDRRCFA